MIESALAESKQRRIFELARYVEETAHYGIQANTQASAVLFLEDMEDLVQQLREVVLYDIGLPTAADLLV